MWELKLPLRSNRKNLYLLILLVTAALLPVIFPSRYLITILIFSLIYALLAISYNLVLGHAGLFSLAHAAFFAVGAYSSALLSVNLNVQFIPSLITAGILTAILAYAIGSIATRTTYHSFGLVTLAFASIISLIFKNWIELTRGPMGIPGIPRPYLQLFNFKIEVTTDLHYYYLTLTIVTISLLFLHKLITSQIGRALRAIRENSVLAEAVGLSSKKYMILAFTISGFFAGISGILYVHFVQYINPDAFALSLTVTALAMTIIGGHGGFSGVLIASFMLFIIPELLRVSPEWREVLFGIFLLLCVYFMPEGLEGLLKQLTTKRK